MMRTQFTCWIVILLVLGAAPAICRGQSTPPEPASTPKDVDVLWGVKIPLRDGVKLNATVYRPAGQKEPLPVAFTLTPYTSDTYHERGWYFAQNGYVFVLVDVRGRGNSEGQFEPFANEGPDGYDAVEWLARQSWCNGKVTMWGGSYAGFDQWDTLKEFPPHLATIVPAAAAHAGIDFPFLNNIFGPYDMQWLTLTSGLTANFRLFGESDYWIAKFRELYLQHRPLAELDRIVGNPSPFFQKWLAHPTPDAYWNAMAPSPEQYRQIRVPILTITGHYDGDQPGAMTYYRRHMQYGAAEAAARHYLIIGPWDHAGTRTPKDEVGGLKFGPASLLDLNKLHKDWYDWTMKNGPKPEFLRNRVAYYVAGLEKWKYAASLDTLANAKLTLYLHSQGDARDAYHSGSLDENAPGPEPQDHYTYDPLDVRPAELEKEEIKNSVTDQRYALNLYGNGVVFHSAPFERDTEISGYAKFTVWLAMDVPDTDLQVALYEIRLDGASIALTAAQMRARYRESLTQAKLVRAGEVNRYEFDGFTFFSRQVAKGSRLRLVLACANSIFNEKNYNSGGIVEQESGKDARTAHIAVYHDAQHPSAIELPLVKDENPH